MAALVQRSFSGGILSPLLRGRADQQKYATGLRTCRNFVPIAAGPALNRSGFEYIGEVANSTKVTCLIPFIFNDAQTYVLEFGDTTLRFIRDGAVLAPSGAVAWSNVTTYAKADLVTSGGHTYYCLAATSLNELPSTHPLVWHAMLSDSFYDIVTPYTSAEVQALRYIQSADVMTLFHPSHPPYELQRYGDTDWILTAVTTGISINPPTGLSATPGIAPAASPAAPTGLNAIGGAVAADHDWYKVTAWVLSPSSEGVASTAAQASVGVATGGSPVALTWNAVGGVDGYAIYKLTDPADLSSPYALIGVSNTNAFSDNGKTAAKPVKLAPLSATGATTFSYKVTAVSSTDGSESEASASISCAGQQPTSARPNLISWGAVTGAGAYNVYKADASGDYGYIGTSTSTNFYDPPTTAGATAGVLQDTTRQPPVNLNLFGSSNNYPSVGSYFQQRLVAGNSNNKPTTVWASRSASLHDFSQSTPLQDDDAVVFAVNGERVNAIRQLATIGGKLVIGTQDGMWTVEGDSSGVLTPTTINLRQQIYGGCSTLRLLAIDNTALYVQARGSTVRDLIYNLDTNGYKGRNLIIFAPHLFESHSIVDWTYQQTPYSLVWAVRDDGVLLSLTYLTEQEVWGWAEHDTGDDVVEAVCCIPEGLEDALYLIVQRTVNGLSKRYLERLHTRTVTDVTTDAFFVDCGLTYDGRNTGATTLTITGGTTWDFDELLTVTASVAAFSAGDVGKAFAVEVGDDTVTIVVSAYTDTTHVHGHAQTSVPAALRGVASAVWARAVKVVTGLAHLQGRTVSALIDGQPQTDLTVASGSVTLARYGSVIHVGIPITADLETLDWEIPQAGTQVDKVKRVNRVAIMVEDARGFTAGEDEDHLVEIKQRIDQSPGDPSVLISDTVDVAIKARWNRGGRVFLRQSNPLPVSVLGLAVTGMTSE